MNNVDRFEEPNLNTGAPWSAWEDQDIRWGLDNNASVEEIANFLCRTPSEIRQRMGALPQGQVSGRRRDELHASYTIFLLG